MFMDASLLVPGSYLAAQVVSKKGSRGAGHGRGRGMRDGEEEVM